MPSHAVRPLIAAASLIVLASGCQNTTPYGPYPEASRPPVALNPAPMHAHSPFAATPDARERHQRIEAHDVKRTALEAVSTFSLDADTGNYAQVRRLLNYGHLPAVGTVRVEELINYFGYDFPSPEDDTPFSVTTEVAPSPWNPNNDIIKIGIKAVDRATDTMPPANLVFLVDVSGSMAGPDRLELAKASLKLLTRQLRAEDTVSMIVYAARTQVELPATGGDRKPEILAAIDRLTAGGSTNGEAAIKLAYDEAAKHFKPGGINRILLMTDGDFNVGLHRHEDLIELIEHNRDRGISLSTLGFGVGNYYEQLMEQAANKGNGNYSYIDTLSEAQKVFGEELSATFITVAKDVKLQVEFNPATVREWRQIGYENRALAEADFNNDQVDAGEIGAGKSVVALYEVTRVGRPGLFDDSRYQPTALPADGTSDELAFLKIRYKAPDGDTSRLLTFPIHGRPGAPPSTDMRFATAVAAYGQLLNGSKHVGKWSFADTRALASAALGEDKGGHRRAFVQLNELAESLRAK